jgi:hypothetical protein
VCVSAVVFVCVCMCVWMCVCVYQLAQMESPFVWLLATPHVPAAARMSTDASSRVASFDFARQSHTAMSDIGKHCEARIGAAGRSVLARAPLFGHGLDLLACATLDITRPAQLLAISTRLGLSMAEGGEYDLLGH